MLDKSSYSPLFNNNFYIQNVPLKERVREKERHRQRQRQRQRHTDSGSEARLRLIYKNEIRKTAKLPSHSGLYNDKFYLELELFRQID